MLSSDAIFRSAWAFRSTMATAAFLLANARAAASPIPDPPAVTTTFPSKSMFTYQIFNLALPQYRLRSWVSPFEGKGTGTAGLRRRAMAPQRLSFDSQVEHGYMIPS
jgi:hypothetical protein